MALRRGGNETRERTAEIKSSPEHVASEVHGVRGWCVLISLLKRSAEVQHSARTTICPEGVQTHQQGQNCSSRLCWPPAHELRSARLEALRNAAHFESDAMPQNKIIQLRRRETSWWDRCRYEHRGHGLTRLVKVHYAERPGRYMMFKSSVQISNVLFLNYT